VSHYLERLLAQSRGELPAIQPRLPGRFEPMAGQEPSNAGDFALEAQAASASATDRSGHLHIDVSAPVFPSVSRPLNALFGDATDDPYRTVPTHEDARRDVMPPTDSAAHLPDQLKATRRAIEATRERGNIQHAHIDQAHHVLAGATSDETKLMDSPTRSWSATLEPDTPRPSLRQPASTAPKTAYTSGQNETVVHVTIGRVDVRAVTPATPRPPARQEPPRRSLDDYLRGTTRR
jgi:hypothetical protein